MRNWIVLPFTQILHIKCLEPISSEKRAWAYVTPLNSFKDDQFSISNQTNTSTKKAKKGVHCYLVRSVIVLQILTQSSMSAL